MPRAAFAYVINRLAANSESFGYGFVSFRSWTKLNVSRLALGQLRRAATLAPIVRVMFDSIEHVFRLVAPPKMPFINASKMPFPTFMYGKWTIFCGFSVSLLANPSMSFDFHAINNCDAISERLGKGPKNTFVGFFKLEHFFEKFCSYSVRHSTGERISMPTPSQIMRGAPSTAVYRLLVAVWNRAYTWISHFDLSYRLDWLGRVMGYSPRRARLFYTVAGA